eukprot:SAG22_NODE_810_length_7063_cov_7.525991_1_plen_1585_part_10
MMQQPACGPQQTVAAAAAASPGAGAGAGPRGIPAARSPAGPAAATMLGCCLSDEKNLSRRFFAWRKRALRKRRAAALVKWILAADGLARHGLLASALERWHGLVRPAAAGSAPAAARYAAAQFHRHGVGLLRAGFMGWRRVLHTGQVHSAAVSWKDAHARHSQDWWDVLWRQAAVRRARVRVMRPAFEALLALCRQSGLESQDEVAQQDTEMSRISGARGGSSSGSGGGGGGGSQSPSHSPGLALPEEAGGLPGVQLQSPTLDYPSDSREEKDAHESISLQPTPTKAVEEGLARGVASVDAATMAFPASASKDAELAASKAVVVSLKRQLEQQKEAHRHELNCVQQALASAESQRAADQQRAAQVLQQTVADHQMEIEVFWQEHEAEVKQLRRQHEERSAELHGEMPTGCTEALIAAAESAASHPERSPAVLALVATEREAIESEFAEKLAVFEASAAGDREGAAKELAAAKAGHRLQIEDRIALEVALESQLAEKQATVEQIAAELEALRATHRLETDDLERVLRREHAVELDAQRAEASDRTRTQIALVEAQVSQARSELSDTILALATQHEQHQLAAVTEEREKAVTQLAEAQTCHEAVVNECEQTHAAARAAMAADHAQTITTELQEAEVKHQVLLTETEQVLQREHAVALETRLAEEKEAWAAEAQSAQLVHQVEVSRAEAAAKSQQVRFDMLHQEHEDALAAASAAAEAHQADMGAAVASIRADTAAEMQVTLKEISAENVEAAMAAAAAADHRMVEAQKGHDAAVTAFSNGHEQAIEALMAEERGKAVRNVAEITAEHQALRAEMEREHASSLDRRLAEERGILEAVHRTVLDEAHLAASERAANDREKLTAEHQAALSAIESQHHAQVETVIRDHTAEKLQAQTDVKSSCDAVVARLVAKHEQHAAVMADNSRAECKFAVTKTAQVLQHQHNLALRQLADEAEATALTAERAAEQLQADHLKHADKVAHLEAQHEESTQLLQTNHERSMQLLRTEHAQRAELLHAERDQNLSSLRAENEQHSELLLTEHRQITQLQQAGHALALVATAVASDAQLFHLQESHEQSLSMLDSQYHQRAVEQSEQATAEHNIYIQQLRQTLQLECNAALEQQLTAERQASEHASEAASCAAANSRAELRETLTAEHQAALAASTEVHLVIKEDALNAQHAKLRQEHATALDEAAAAAHALHSEEIAALQVEASTVLRESEGEHAAAVAAIVAEHKQQVATELQAANAQHQMETKKQEHHVRQEHELITEQRLETEMHALAESHKTVMAHAKAAASSSFEGEKVLLHVESESALAMAAAEAHERLVAVQTRHASDMAQLQASRERMVETNVAEERERVSTELKSSLMLTHQLQLEAQESALRQEMAKLHEVVAIRDQAVARLSEDVTRLQGELTIASELCDDRMAAEAALAAEQQRLIPKPLENKQDEGSRLRTAATAQLETVLQCVEVNKWLIQAGYGEEADVLLRSFAEAGYVVEEWLSELQSMDPAELGGLATAAARQSVGPRDGASGPDKANPSYAGRLLQAEPTATAELEARLAEAEARLGRTTGELQRAAETAFGLQDFSQAAA